MRRKRAIALWILGTMWLGCSEGPMDPPPPPLEGLVVSNPSPNVAAASLARRGASSGMAFSFAAQIAEETDVAYISLPPATYVNGALARIQSPRVTGTVTASMVDGGLDPVPVTANAGDSVEIEILSSDGLTLARIGSRVPTTRRPRVVRTVPPRGKTDVAVNALIVVVFSEPVDASSVSSSSLQLFRGTTPIAGTTRLLEGVTAAAVFEPSTTLAPNAVYRLVVTGAVRDLTGDSLEAPLSVEFTTGTGFVGPVHVVTVTPDTTELLVGSQVLLTAVGRDSSLTPVIGQPVLWSSETPAVASVSETGLVTALAAGEARVRAQVGFQTGQATVIVTGSQLPAASLTLIADSSTIPLGPRGGTVRLRAVVRDASGNVLPFRQVGWTTSDPAIATATAGSGGTAIISALSAGTAMITAVSEGLADTAMIRVVRPGPYARVVAGGSDPYGGAHTCGVTTDDWVLCWGANRFGELGNGTPGPAEAPVGVGGTRFPQLATGSLRNCALTPDGAAYCWGDAGLGALGLGTTAAPDRCFALCSETPIAVFGGLRFTTIGVGQEHACALTSSGVAYCWGYNANGLLGMGVMEGPEDCVSGDGRSGPCSTVPVAVVGGLRFTALAVGGFMGVSGEHSCGITTTGAAYCWGENTFGQLGDGTTSHRAAPVPVAGGLSFTALAIGFAHTCGLTVDGSAYCWGWNSEGQLGTGSIAGPQLCQYGGPIPCSTVPVRVSGALLWASISAGAHTCGVTPTGDAYCWGGSGPQLGTGTNASTTAPTAVTGGLKFASVSAGYGHSCGVTQTGTAYCWGANDTGQLGTGSTVGSGVPVRVVGQP